MADGVHGKELVLRRRYGLAHATDPTCERFSDLCDLPEIALDGRRHGYMAWRDGTRVRMARYTP